MKTIRLILLISVMLNFATSLSTQPKALGIGELFKTPIAVQLWSFREAFKTDVQGTLNRVHDLGFTSVELAGYYGMTAPQFKLELDKAGLKAVSMHIEFEAAESKIDEFIKDAKILGVTNIGVPWINAPFTLQDCEKAIAVFNQAGARCASHGITFFYHTHGYEFVPNPKGNGTLFELLMAKTNPKFVKYQLDTFHVTYPGQDPAKLLQKYPKRFVSLHLKDLRKDVVGDNSGGMKDDDGCPLGQGKINWPEVLRAARKDGVQWYILEDETPTVWQAVPQSLNYLTSLKY